MTTMMMIYKIYKCTWLIPISLIFYVNIQLFLLCTCYNIQNMVIFMCINITKIHFIKINVDIILILVYFRCDNDLICLIMDSSWCISIRYCIYIRFGYNLYIVLVIYYIFYDLIIKIGNIYNYLFNRISIWKIFIDLTNFIIVIYNVFTRFSSYIWNDSTKCINTNCNLFTRWNITQIFIRNDLYDPYFYFHWILKEVVFRSRSCICITSFDCVCNFDVSVIHIVTYFYNFNTFSNSQIIFSRRDDDMINLQKEVFNWKKLFSSKTKKKYLNTNNKPTLNTQHYQGNDILYNTIQKKINNIHTKSTTHTNQIHIIYKLIMDKNVLNWWYTKSSI